MKKILFLLLMMYCLVNVSGASSYYEVPVKVTTVYNDTGYIKYVKLVSNDYSSIMSVESDKPNTLKYSINYNLNNTNIVVNIPVNITTKFNDKDFSGLYINSSSMEWSKTGMNKDNPYYNFSIVYEYTGDTNVVNDTINYDKLNASFGILKDEIGKEISTRNEEFSSNFIQYFENQYGVKVTELKDKDEKITQLNLQVADMNNQLQRLKMNNSILQSQVNDLQFERIFTTLFVIVLIAVLLLLMGIRKGTVQRMIGSGLQ